MIVVGVDGSLNARAAVEWAVNDAFRTHMPLKIVYAVDRSPYQTTKFPAVGLPDMPLSKGRTILAEATALAHERQPDVEVTTEEVEGAPAVVLRKQAEQAREIVVGSRGRGGLPSALLGSVSVHVAGQTACPVVVVHGERQPARGQIVVGVDDSTACEPALAYAFEQARLRGATLRALYAWQLPVNVLVPQVSYGMDEARTAPHQVVTDRLEAFRKEYPQVRVVEDVRCADPVDALTKASAEADLLVVGSHGRGAVAAALLGSVSRGVLHHARCAVAVVRAS
ncbi:universal stress protein [Nonomuraea glycinis]|uniref:universal stress protein n=1 Tax=Nonomuraea glycinis TaxID=2047744 RepID=UPI002E0F52AF|nr:universal stress protein [Nonomuraea glycinis]